MKKIKKKLALPSPRFCKTSTLYNIEVCHTLNKHQLLNKSGKFFFFFFSPKTPPILHKNNIALALYRRNF